MPRRSGCPGHHPRRNPRSRLTRTRATVATGLALGTATAGLFLAPAALAAPPAGALAAPDAPASVVAGATFTISGTGCTTDDPADPVAVELYTEYASDDVYLLPDTDGSWSTEMAFYADATPGTYTVWAACESYNGVVAESDINTYPDTTITVTAPAAAPTASTPTASTPTASTPTASTPAPATFTPGATPNTPGIAVTKNSTTSNVAKPGQQVTQVLKGFKPNEKVTLVLHSTPVTLGVFTAAANGVLTATYTIPAGTTLATHTLAFDGDAGSHYEIALTLTADGKALAYTGASVALPLIGGTALLAAGAGALVIGRHRRPAGAVQA